MRMALAVFVALLITISSVTFAATAPELHISGNEPERARNGFDPAAFRSLPDADKLAFAIAKLKQREAELANLSYKIEETTVNNRIRGGTGRRFMSRQDWEYRRLGKAYWLKHVDYDYEMANLIVRQSTLIAFDGKVTKSTPDPATSDVHSCNITPGEDRSLNNFEFEQVLGFHARPISERPVSLVDWLEKKGDADRKIAVTAEDLHHAPAVRINVLEGDQHWNYWLDPAHDFMIERMESNYAHGAAVINRWSIEVQEATRVAGVWIPKKALAIASSAGFDEQSERTFLATHLQTGQVRERDVRLDIPADAKIFDQVRNISYEPLPDGTFRLLPLRDIQGLLHVPPTDPIVKHIDDDTAKLYTLKEEFDPRHRR